MGSYLDSPQYQRMMAETLRGNGGGPQYPGQAIANGIAQALQAYTLKKYGQQQDAREQKRNSDLADVLSPPTTTLPASPQAPVDGGMSPSLGPRPSIGGVPGSGSMPGPAIGKIDASLPQLQAQGRLDIPGTTVTPGANHDKLAALLNAGIGTEELGKQALRQIGFGEPPKIEKFGKDERGFILNPDDPTNPKQVISGAPPERDFNKPFDNITGEANKPYQEYEGDLRTKGRPQTNVNVSADRSFGTQLGENAGKILDASHNAAQSGLATIRTADQIRGAIDSGQVTAGPGATAIQFIRQVSGGDPEKIVATRQTIQGLAQLALSARGALKGQGQISDYEGRLLQKAAAGNIDEMTVPEIRSITDVADRAARISIKQNATNVAKARTAAPNNGHLVDFYDVAEPPPYAAAPRKSGRFTIEPH